MTRKIKSVITVTLCAALCTLCISLVSAFGGASVKVAPSSATVCASADGRAAQNGWKVAPNIMRWNYGGFIAEQNVIVAQPLYLSAGSAADDPDAQPVPEEYVHFSLLDGEKNILSVPVTDGDGNISAK